MTGDDWKRVKAIALDASTRPEPGRVSYVTQACAGDADLQREVLSLLGAMAAAEDGSDMPPWLADPLHEAAAFAALIGRRLGAYEILSRVGAGGMGEIYKARDTRLDRIVAIKVLPARASADPVSRERIAREARAVAALKHPHICTIYDIGSQDGLDFFVMEFVDGETLATRLGRGRLPIPEALRYAEQIGTALSEAHRAGIVHRDVKPANIMLDAGGRTFEAPRAKLLDFGVAKASSAEASTGSPGPATGGALDLTAAGLVFGTAHYMSPEQVEGKATDARTDIFAFGAVLFEMLTGRKAFSGADQSEVLAAIRSDHPPRASKLRPALAPALDRIVARCLAKNPSERYQNLEDLLVDLRTVQRRLESAHRVRMLVTAAAVLVVILGTVAWMIWNGRDRSGGSSPSLVRLPASAGVLGAAALSPDGSNLAFSWAGDGIDNPELVLLRFGETTRIRLTNDPGVEEWPVWSPDGREIAFIRCVPDKCAIFSLPVSGGPERKLRDLRTDRYFWLAWSPDGHSIVYAERASVNDPYALFVLSIDTLATRRLTAPASGGGELRFAFSPDGTRLAVIRRSDGFGIHVLSFGTGEGSALLSGQEEWFGGITWSADGRHLILSANQQGIRRLWRLPAEGGSLEQLTIAGEDAYFPAISGASGRLTFVRELSDWDFARMTIADGRLGSFAPFPSSTRLDLDPAFSPDGRKLAFASERSGTRELWVANADGSAASQVTHFNGFAAGRPSWSPDGEYLAFHARGIHVVSTRGGSPRKVFGDGELPTWSADGQWIYFMLGFRIWRVPAQGGAAAQAITSEASVAREVPGGEDVYFAKVPGGIWRRPVAGGEETPVAADFTYSLPGYWAVFSDGIYYVVREALDDGTFVHHFKFFDFAHRRTTSLGQLSGIIDHWVGGLTVSPDRRTVVYSQRTYQSREIILVEGFR